MATATRLQVLDPTVQPIPASAVIAPRPETLDGAVVGLLSNGKRNADVLLGMVHEVLADRFEFKDVMVRDKGNASRPCPTDLLQEMADQCDLVITSSGDWGSCSSCSMHDGIEFEKKGVPTAVICTEPFINSAKAMSKLGGIPEYPFVVLPHPLGSLTPDTLRERAMQAAPEIVQILLAKG